MSGIIIPGEARPNNLRFGPDVNVRLVDSDVFDICNRIRDEVSERLFIIVAEEEDHSIFVIMEHCDDNVDRIVWKTHELDARVIEKAQYMRRVPLNHRVAAIEKDLEKWEAEQKEEHSEELYERLGGPMYNQLEHDGFTQRGRSYPKIGVAAPGRRR